MSISNKTIKFKTIFEAKQREAPVGDPDLNPPTPAPTPQPPAAQAGPLGDTIKTLKNLRDEHADSEITNIIEKGRLPDSFVKFYDKLEKYKNFLNTKNVNTYDIVEEISRINQACIYKFGLPFTYEGYTKYSDPKNKIIQSIGDPVTKPNKTLLPDGFIAEDENKALQYKDFLTQKFGKLSICEIINNIFNPENNTQLYPLAGYQNQTQSRFFYKKEKNFFYGYSIGPKTYELQATFDQISIENIVLVLYSQKTTQEKEVDTSNKDWWKEVEKKSSTAPETNKKEPPKKGTPSTKPQPKPAAGTLTYNIKNPPTDNFIKDYQKLLITFSKNHNLTKQALASIEQKELGLEKLDDGQYGRRSHYVSIQAIRSFKAAVEKALTEEGLKENKAKRVEVLAKLLNEKLAGTKSNWLFEEDTKLTRDALKGLLKKLNELEGKFTGSFDITDWEQKPTGKESMDKKSIEEFMKLMGLAQFDNNGNIINLDKIAKEATPEQKPAPPPAPPPPPKPEPPKEDPRKDVAQVKDASCWYTFNVNIRGAGATSPKMIWGAADLDFKSWYENINSVMTNEAIPEDYNFSIGTRTGYKAMIDLLYLRKDQNMNLSCFVALFDQVRDYLKSSSQEAVSEYLQTNKADSARAEQFFQGMKGSYLNDSKSWENTKIHKAFLELDKVLTVGIPKLKNGLINVATNMKEKGMDLSVVSAVNGMATGTPQKEIPIQTSTTTDASKLPAVTPAAPTPKQESLKEKREQLLHEALFRKLVK